jgi:tripartite-type tricarboxylate transporter receptor subunit TctC
MTSRPATRRRALGTLATPFAMFTAGLPATAARAQSTSTGYPDKPIRLVVGFAAGGATDILGRQINAALGNALAQQVYIDNRGGGNGYPAWSYVAHAPADGYTLLLGENSMAIMPGLYRNQPTQPARELLPVGFVGTAPFVLIVHPDVKARDLQEFIATARAKPGSVQYGSAGNGTPTQLCFEVLKLATGIDAQHIPYKGGGPAMVDLLGGQFPGMFAAWSVAKPYMDSGKVRALALTGPRRAPEYPDLPTFAEAGVPLPDMDLGQWWGVFAPPTTPPDVVARVNDALRTALAQPEVKERLAKQLSITVETGPPALLATRYAAELARWPEVIRRAKDMAD